MKNTKWIKVTEKGIVTTYTTIAPKNPMNREIEKVACDLYVRRNDFHEMDNYCIYKVVDGEHDGSYCADSRAVGWKHEGSDWVFYDRHNKEANRING